MITGDSGTQYPDAAWQAILADPTKSTQYGPVMAAIKEAQTNLATATAVQDLAVMGQVGNNLAWLTALNVQPASALERIKAKIATLTPKQKIVGAGLLLAGYVLVIRPMTRHRGR